MKIIYINLEIKIKVHITKNNNKTKIFVNLEL